MNDDIKRVTEQFGQELDGVFDTRAAGVAEVVSLQSLARATLQAEALRLEAQLGPADPRTVLMKSRLANNLGVLRALEVVAETLSIRGETPEEGETLVEGVVVDVTGRGQVGLSVGLVDERRGLITAVEQVTTVQGGYFALHLSGEQVALLRLQFTKGVFVAGYSENGVLLAVTDAPLPLEEPKIPPITLVVKTPGTEPSQPAPVVRPMGEPAAKRPPRKGKGESKKG